MEPIYCAFLLLNALPWNTSKNFLCIVNIHYKQTILYVFLNQMSAVFLLNKFFILQPFEGDGWCDTINNRAYCQYDGGDCCPSTLSSKKVNIILKAVPLILIHHTLLSHSSVTAPISVSHGAATLSTLSMNVAHIIMRSGGVFSQRENELGGEVSVINKWLDWAAFISRGPGVSGHGQL